MLRFFYGSSTRTVRVLNLTMALIYLIISIMYFSGYVVVYLPVANNGFIAPILTVVVFNIIFNILSFTIHKQHARRLFKVMSLLLGALHQVCVAAAYVNDYPPFQSMILVALIFVIWFIGAAYYVVRVEGLYGDV